MGPLLYYNIFYLDCTSSRGKCLRFNKEAGVGSRSIQVPQKLLKSCLHPDFQVKRRYINIHKHVRPLSKKSLCFVKNTPRLALFHKSNLDTWK